MSDRKDGAATKSIGDRIADRDAIDAALKRAFYKAVVRHRQANVPMVFAEDEKIVTVSPFDVPIPDDKK